MTTSNSTALKALGCTAPNFKFSKLYPDVMTLKECYAYISQYFVPLKDGNHAVFEDGKYTIKDEATVKKVYFNRMPLYEIKCGEETYSTDLSKWYFNKYTGIRTVTYELNKDVFFEHDKINLCPQIKHVYQKYETFSDKTRAKVDIMMSYIREVLANGQEDAHTYLLRWLSHMVKGNKNDSILYFKSKQGYGKSTLLEFMREFVIGDDLSLETGSQYLLSNFNAVLGGKLFVYFEELETFSTAQWMACSSKLKRYATSLTIILEEKNMKAFTTKNMMNIIVASNNDAIMDDDGRRYFILDISNKRQIIPNCTTPRNEENKRYWNDVHSCFNNEVGHAFYCFLMEVDTTNYRPQDFPTTQSKLDSYAKRLETHENFLKYNYVLRRGELKTNVADLYAEYTDYCRGNGVVKPLTKIDFNKKLKEIGIESYKSNKENNKLKVSVDELQEIAKCRHWVHETDEYFDETQEATKTKPHDLDFGLSEHPEITIEKLEKDICEEKKLKNQYWDERDAFKEEVERLKAELEELKKRTQGPQAPPAPPAQAKKSIIAFIDESEEESDPETNEIVKLKDNKVVAALTALDA